MSFAMAAILLAATGQVQAATIAFVPPNDTLGGVFSTVTNDGYSDGRGVVFAMTDDVVIDSVGIFQNLRSINLSFQISKVTTTSGNVASGEVILRSGSSTETTTTLEWIDFAITPLTLQNGMNYLIEFTFQGNSNQNFFYNNQNVSFNQADFSLLDGTQAGFSDNFVMPAIRVNTVERQGGPVVPEPTSLALAGFAGIGMAVRAIRRRRQAQAAA